MPSGKWRPFCLGLSVIGATWFSMSKWFLKLSFVWNTWCIQPSGQMMCFQFIPPELLPLLTDTIRVFLFVLVGKQYQLICPPDLVHHFFFFFRDWHLWNSMKGPASRLAWNSCFISAICDLLTHWLSGDKVVILSMQFSDAFQWLIIFLMIGSISCEIALRWMLQNLVDYKSTLVQAMAWCRQAPSHYLNLCSTSSKTPYGATRGRWV